MPFLKKTQDTISMSHFCSWHQIILHLTAPVVTQRRAVVNAPGTGGLFLTMVGLSFAARDTTPTSHAGLGFSGCRTASWVSSTSVFCVASAALVISVHPSSRGSVTVNSVVGTSPTAEWFTFDGHRPMFAHDRTRTRGKRTLFIRTAVSSNV